MQGEILAVDPEEGREQIESRVPKMFSGGFKKTRGGKDALTPAESEDLSAKRGEGNKKN